MQSEGLRRAQSGALAGVIVTHGSNLGLGVCSQVLYVP